MFPEITRPNHMAKWLPLGLSLLALSCASGCRPARRPALLGFSCPDRSASVFVDGHYVGTVKLLAHRFLVLEPGTHRVEIRKMGRFTRYRVLKLQAGQVGVLEIRLVPELPWLPEALKTRKHAKPSLSRQ